jgi:amino-acid racemase
MKTIGLIGGVSWQSTAEYYRIINQEVCRRLGGLHSAKILMYSFDFEEILPHQKSCNDAAVTRMLVGPASHLERSGADFIVICSNTTNKMADDVAAQLSIPVLHIADVTGEAILSKGLKKVGLLGTRYTMEEDFIKLRLRDKFGLDVVIPNDAGRRIVSEIIYNELCLGDIKEESRSKYQQIIEELADDGAEGVILGCTEIPLLIQQEHSAIPVFDTTEIHALATVDYALSE